MVYEDKIFNGINDKRLTRLVRPWPEGHAYLSQSDFNSFWIQWKEQKINLILNRNS